MLPKSFCLAMYIDGEEAVNYDYTDVTSCKVAEVIVQSYSYGESYTVTWGVPEVSFAPVVVSNAEELAAAVAAAQNGSVILVDGEITLTKTLTLSGKAVTVKGLEGSIDPRLLTAFNRIRKSTRNGLGIVYVQRDACGGCFNKIPPQRQLDIKMRKKIIVCEYCGRIMIDKELAGVKD